MSKTGHNATNRLACHGLVLLCLLLLTGCHSTKTVFRNPSFDAASLQSGGLAIVSVTRPEERDYYATPHIAEHMEAEFRRRWPGMKIMTMHEVQTALGPQQHLAIQDAFRERAVLRQDQLSLLDPLASSVGYVLLVDVREDNADGGYSVSQAEVEQYELDSQTGYHRLLRSETQYTASWSHVRSMRSLFVIYDLRAKDHVWITTTRDSKSFSTSASSSYGVPYVRQSAGISPQELMGIITRRTLKDLPPSALKKPRATSSMVAGE